MSETPASRPAPWVRSAMMMVHVIAIIPLRLFVGLFQFLRWKDRR